MDSKKKAQVSVFIIIAVILVFSMIFMFSVNKEGTSFSFFKDEGAAYLLEERIESCISDQTNYAMDMLALSGGWMYHQVPDQLFVGRDTFKYYIQMGQGYEDIGGVEHPYWYYYDDTQEEFLTRIPDFSGESPYSMRSQLSRFLNQTLEQECFSPLLDEENGFDYSYDREDLSVELEFNLGERDVKVDVYLPILISSLEGDLQESVNFFSYERRNSLRIPYLIARDIIEAEIEDSFVEFRMIDYLKAYQDSNSRELLPPFYDFRNKADYQPWYLDDSKELVGRVIESNLNSIVFLSTVPGGMPLLSNLGDSQLNDEQKTFVQGAQSMHQNNYLEENSYALAEYGESYFNEYVDYSVEGKYSSYLNPLFFSVGGSYGDVLLFPTVESVLGGILPFFFTEYSSSYEITTPLSFEITSKNYPLEKPFTLYLETNIRHNKPLREEYNFEVDPQALAQVPKADSLICDPSQFTSEMVYVNISDRIDFGERTAPSQHKPGVEDAFLSFTCKGEFVECHLGQTKVTLDEFGREVTQLGFRLPQNCDPIELKISKYGHTSYNTTLRVDSLTEPLSLGEVFLDSSKKLELDIIKYKFASNQRFNFKEGEEGFVLFKHKTQEDFVAIVEVNKSSENLSLKLIPGNYTVEGFVLTQGEDVLSIPEDCVGGTSGSLFTSGRDCTPIPEITADSWMTARVMEQNFEVKVSDLFNHDSLQIVFSQLGVPTTLNQLSSFSQELSQEGVGRLEFYNEN